MIDDNPYRAPAAIPVAGEKLLPQGTEAGIWSDGKLLVVHKQATLPPICVKTRRAAEETITRKFRWHPPRYYTLLFVHIFIYAVVVQFVCRKHELAIPLSMETASRRRSKIVKCWFVGVLGFALLFVGAFGSVSSRQIDSTLWAFVALVAAGFVIMIAATWIGSFAALILVPKRMNDHVTWFKGLDPDYVASFPSIPLDL